MPHTVSRPVLRASLRILSLAALCAAGSAMAADAAPDNAWHGSINIGGAFASGTSSSRTLSGAADTSKASAIDKISLNGSVNYGHNTSNGVGTTTADQLRLAGRYDYNLGPSMFAFGGLETETNKVAGIDSRYDLSGGLGYKVMRTAVVTADVFAGVGYSNVRFHDSTSASGATLTLGEESAYKISESTSFKQRLVIHPGQKDLGTLTTFDAGLATAITGGWTLNTGLGVRHSSKPPVGAKATDSLLTVGFGYKF